MSGEPPAGPGCDPEPHVLVVEDDSETRRLIVRLLRENGLRATGARDGKEMWEALRHAPVDLILLDVMLPGETGFDLCRDLRGRGAQVPVIMVTARGNEADRVRGLDIGADDYLPKPFSQRELLARARAVLRRSAPGTVDPAGVATPARPGRMLAFAGWTLDTARRELVSPAGAVVELSGGEYDLLITLVEHPQRVLSRERLLELARNRVSVDPASDRSVDVQVSRLRRKLEPEEGSPTVIKTVRGAGYMFVPQVEPQ
jgi:two-component system, OmpR family, response regulator